MTDEEIKLLKTLPERWQIAILDREIFQLRERLLPTVPRPETAERGCGTIKLLMYQSLESLQSLRSTLQEN